MDRREKLLSGLARADLLGLEIGALNNPVARKSDGPVLYVDHFDTAALREKYRNDPNVDVDAIVDVDAVWGAQTLAQCIGENRKVDYVLASHVIEHVPDLITWLEEISSILTPSGELRLAVPDRRFSFDFFRNETRFSELVAGWRLRARRPQPQQLADHMLNITNIDLTAAWRQAPDAAVRSRLFDFPGVCAVITDSLTTGAYHDVHCSVFTPASFAGLMLEIVQADLADFGCAFFHDTGPGTLEFLVAMKRMADPAEAARSWQAMQQAARQDLPPPVDREAAPVSAPAPAPAELEVLRAQLELIRRSTSWRVTAPIRAAVDAVRRRRAAQAGRTGSSYPGTTAPGLAKPAAHTPTAHTPTAGTGNRAG